MLLIKQKYGALKSRWALVGGFVKDDESLNDAVNRELQEEAGITVNYSEQLCTFGDAIDLTVHDGSLKLPTIILPNDIILSPVLLKTGEKELVIIKVQLIVRLIKVSILIPKPTK